MFLSPALHEAQQLPAVMVDQSVYGTWLHHSHEWNSLQHKNVHNTATVFLNAFDKSLFYAAGEIQQIASFSLLKAETDGFD